MSVVGRLSGCPDFDRKYGNELFTVLIHALQTLHATGPCTLLIRIKNLSRSVGVFTLALIWIRIWEKEV